MPQSISEVTYLTVIEACKVIPGGPCKNTVIRWFDRGYNGIKLKSWRCGNRRVTTVPAIDAFLAATTGIQDPNPRSTSSAHQQAEARLDALGVK